MLDYEITAYKTPAYYVGIPTPYEFQHVTLKFHM